ncbi:Aste57867_11588 [Aphanomyces stellatus]|uniref:Aste57867_11588 protein n=1 Tax=Aphanomyces stellatus TaxID=120398 RepID=A0A485KTF5_9STRA|nr:hypothetical protein As57867_011545 [Aphanomyces stellatus]VFT88447.1 Aste57867_11588 [Aphanomyces stellatus]
MLVHAGILLVASCLAHVHGVTTPLQRAITLPLTRLTTTHEEAVFLLQGRRNVVYHLPSLRSIDAPLTAGRGVHTATIFVGTDAQRRDLIVDTGSAVTAFACVGCDCGEHHAHPFYTPSTSAEVITCGANDELGLRACSNTHFCRADLDNDCRVTEAYVEGSEWSALKMRDTVRFVHEDDDETTKANLVFGCMQRESGAFIKQGSDGIMGMSQDKDAVFMQLFDQGMLATQAFSQCLSDTGGRMVLGGIDAALNMTHLAYIPLRRDSGYSYWTVTLDQVDVGGHVVDVDPVVYNADRGCVLDSGTTYVYMPMAAKEAFQAAWRRATGGGAYEDAALYILSPDELQALPTIGFTFQGKTMELAPRQYMAQTLDDDDEDDDDATTYKSALFFREFAHATILGASILAHHNVLYDLEHGVVGFAPADCDAAERASPIFVTDFAEALGDGTRSMWLGSGVVVVLLVIGWSLQRPRAATAAADWDDGQDIAIVLETHFTSI